MNKLGARAATGSPSATFRLLRPFLISLLAAGTLVLAATPGMLVGRSGGGSGLVATVGATAADRALEARVRALESDSPPDWAKVAALVEPSVMTIVAGPALGSAWVAGSSPSGSQLVTNYHVVAATWEAGGRTVEVHRSDHAYEGTIVTTDPGDDLALVSVSEHFPALRTASMRPPLAEAVMAVGSPLGLDGSVSTGVVSGFRSIDGSDYLQFSAPISPGNSGGPLVDSRGVVVGVSTEKAVGQGVEALAFAIPVQTVCAVLTHCQDDSATSKEG